MNEIQDKWMICKYVVYSFLKNIMTNVVPIVLLLCRRSFIPRACVCRISSLAVLDIDLAITPREIFQSYESLYKKLTKNDQ